MELAALRQGAVDVGEVVAGEVERIGPQRTQSVVARGRDYLAPTTRNCLPSTRQASGRRRYSAVSRLDAGSRPVNE